MKFRPSIIVAILANGFSWGCVGAIIKSGKYSWFDLSFFPIIIFVTTAILIQEANFKQP